MTSTIEASTLARTVVASARDGAIVLGPARFHAAENRLACQVIDHDGEPVLALRSSAAARQAADRLVRLDLVGTAGRASLLGRLQRTAPERVLAQAGNWEAGVLRASLRAGATLLQLSVHAVSVERSRQLQRVELEDYADADPDPIAAHGPRILAHLNDAHPERLRAVAAYALAHRAGPLVGAELARIDDEGIQLWAVDSDGAQLVRVDFPGPISDVDGLVAAMRAVLTLPPALRPPA